MTRRVQDEAGLALMMVLLIVMIVGVLAIGAVTMLGNSSLISAYEDQQTTLESVADAGIEQARARINGDPTLYPDSGYATLESNAPVTDAAGAVIPGVTRTTYAGPTGVATGQYGVFGSVVVVAKGANGDQVIRRGEIVQESFAKFAYFTDDENGISFGGGDQIQGPVHSNDAINILSSGAKFKGPGSVTTHMTVTGSSYATFSEGSARTGVPAIPMPTTADLAKLQSYATAGGTAFTPPNGGNPDETRMRIEFVGIDLDGDLRTTGPDEGFFKVYQSNSADWVMARRPSPAALIAVDYCGQLAGNVLNRVDLSGGNAAAKVNFLKNPSRRCFLGGSNQLNGGVFQANDAHGSWVARAWAWNNMPAVIAGRTDAAYLFPLSRTFNPNFKGVIHVNGRVGISGLVRGRVTLAATGAIYILDDLKYASDAGGACADILGLFSGGDIVVADNTLNAPAEPQNGAGYYTFDETSSETVQAVVLTLKSFTAQNYSGGPTDVEDCEGINWGRGCLYLAGGVIQGLRGGVGTAAGTGYLKRYSYDACAYYKPPPYYPTTGRFGRGRYFEIDPTNFNISTYMNRITAG
ncbi:MAG TPA: hypothetical protein VFE05_18255 [Longimicrobiaceae bacterium]|jgi:Tfp pilus assembly protein PilX|nr:hypothetical protein [Longimicrobiaceae bacterium]